MSALTERITEVLTGFRVDPSPAVCGCFDLTPEDAAHVAERVAEALQLTEEAGALAALGERFLRASASLFDLEATASHEGEAMRLKAKRSGVELALSYLLEAERVGWVAVENNQPQEQP